MNAAIQPPFRRGLMFAPRATLHTLPTPCTARSSNGALARTVHRPEILGHTSRKLIATGPAPRRALRQRMQKNSRYPSEIERTWRVYVGLAKPTQVRLIRLRYINRILLPIEPAPLEIEDYLKLGPRLADEANLAFVSFFNQYAAVEVASGFQVNVTLTVQPEEGGFLPVTFDNAAFSNEQAAPENWALLLERITALRALKSRVFENTLTERCLELFQTP